ncbi:MAG: DUF2764 family protein [Chlamydiia bacterium]|nr:DUF2764 family protein [Chlamydiia bacterium]
MTEYYFLASLLPELQIGHVPGLGYAALKPLLIANLNKKDLAKTKKFLHIFDYDNLRALWVGDVFDKRGNFTKIELEQALIDLGWPDGQDFPDYLVDYLGKYQKNEERAKNYFILVSRFLQEQLEKEEGFLQELFQFEKEFRLILIGFRAKKLGRKLSVELQYEDSTDSIVAQILAQKDSKGYEPPFEYHETKFIFDDYGDHPIELHKACLKYRFAKYVELCGSAIFSIDRILGYIARLLLVEKWIELDIQMGVEIIDDIVREVK